MTLRNPNRIQFQIRVHSRPPRVQRTPQRISSRWLRSKLLILALLESANRKAARVIRCRTLVHKRVRQWPPLFSRQTSTRALLAEHSKRTTRRATSPTRRPCRHQCIFSDMESNMSDRNAFNKYRKVSGYKQLIIVQTDIRNQAVDTYDY